LNKSDIKKKLKEKPTEEEINETALAIAEKGTPEYIDILLDKNPRIGRAVQLFITGEHTRAEIGDILGVQAATVGKWLRDPDVKKYMDMMTREQSNIVKSRIVAATTAAVNKMINLLDSPIDGVALQAAKDLLDRAGHKPKQEIKKEVTIKSFEEELSEVIDIDALDVDYEEVDEDDTNEEDDE